MKHMVLSFVLGTIFAAAATVLVVSSYWGIVPKAVVPPTPVAAQVNHTGNIWTAGNAKYEVVENNNPAATDCRFILQSADGKELLAGPNRLAVELVAEAMCESAGQRIIRYKGALRFSDTTHEFFVGPTHGAPSRVTLFVPGAAYACAIETYWERRDAEESKSRAERDPEIRIIHDGDRVWVGSMGISYDVDAVYPSGYSLIVRCKDPRSIARADKPKPVRQLQEAEAAYYAYGTVDDLDVDGKNFEPRLKGLKVSTSEKPGEDWVTAPAPADAINMARIVQWYWTPSRATRLPQ